MQQEPCLDITCWAAEAASVSVIHQKEELISPIIWFDVDAEHAVS
jgi:hypothetical protein